MKSKIYLTILLFTLLIFTGCKNHIERALIGHWVIEDISLHGENARYFIVGNTMDFHKKGECRLPPNENRFLEHGQYELIQADTKPFRIRIDADNDFFSGEYNLTFEKDEKRKVLLLIMESDNELHIKASKWWFNIDSDKKLMEELL